MIIVRLLALAFWVLAALALGGDLWEMSRSGSFEARTLGQRWADVDVESLTMVQNLIERHVSPDLWNPGIVKVLSWPAWAVLGGLALLLSLVARLRR